MHDSLERSRALFIRRWGEMGGYWGITRTMAELHALLYLSSEPLCTDEIMEALQISRGNTSMNLRQLVNWGLVNRVHKKGDRKEYFAAETNVWEMFETIVRERRRREVEPIIETINRCRDMVAEKDKSEKQADREAVRIYRERLENMADFLNSVMGLVNVLLAGGGETSRNCRRCCAERDKVHESIGDPYVTLGKAKGLNLAPCEALRCFASLSMTVKPPHSTCVVRLDAPYTRGREPLRVRTCTHAVSHVPWAERSMASAPVFRSSGKMCFRSS